MGLEIKTFEPSKTSMICSRRTTKKVRCLLACCLFALVAAFIAAFVVAFAFFINPRVNAFKNMFNLTFFCAHACVNVVPAGEKNAVAANKTAGAR